MDCSRPLDGIDKEVGSTCIGKITTEETDYGIMEGNNMDSSVGECFGLNPSSTIRGFVHVFRSTYGVKPSGNASAWPYRHLDVKRFN